MEVNCWVNGRVQPYFVEDKIWGEHHAGAALEAYLGSDAFFEKIDKPVIIDQMYMGKDLIVPEECFVIKSNLDTVFNDLESVICTIPLGENRIYPKTIDLSTIGGGIIHLVNKDRNKLLDDLNTIKRIQKEEFDKILDIKNSLKGY